MREKILQIIENQNYKPLSAKEFARALDLNTAPQLVQIMKTLNALDDEHIIGHDKDGRFNLLSRMNRIVGTIEIKDHGYGFVSSDALEKDVFIPERLTMGAYNRDTVLVQIEEYASRGPEGAVIEIIKRNLTYLFGTLKKKGSRYFVIPDDFKVGMVAEVAKADLGTATINDKVKAFITYFGANGRCNAEIVEVIGAKDDPGVDISLMVASSMLKTTFDDATLKFSATLPDEVSEGDFVNRRDLRDKLIFTIDGDDAKDYDDAVGLDVLKNGNYLLGVYIADVSHYVNPDNALDLEALSRCFSIYLPDRVIPMLPEKLSNGLCSLKPYVDRLVLACEMEIDAKGKVINYDIFEAVIKSKARLTYRLVNKMLVNNDINTINSLPGIYDVLVKMNQLATILTNMRYERGALTFETKEAKVILNKDGKTKDVVINERSSSEKLIEEFMLICNETVSTAMSYTETPFLYRVHEEPKSEKIMQFKTIAKMMGYNIPCIGNDIHPKELQQLLVQAEDDIRLPIISTLLLRSQAKARYHDVNLGHYGLASSCYTHFTSPIRRYPDLLVHRLVKKNYLYKGESSFDDELITRTVAQEASRIERLIERLERDVLDMKKAEYMQRFIGQTFDGVISSVTKWGFYVELPNTIEGLVSVDNMGRGYYTYNEENLCWYNPRTNEVFQIGDHVTVELLAASKERREIDFLMKGVIK